MIHVRVTRHAAERCLERVNPRLTLAEAIDALSSTAIRRAVEFGAPYVKLGTGQHVALEGSTVVTVLPKDEHLGCMGLDRQRRIKEFRR